MLGEDGGVVGDARVEEGGLRGRRRHGGGGLEWRFSAVGEDALIAIRWFELRSELFGGIALMLDSAVCCETKNDERRHGRTM